MTNEELLQLIEQAARGRVKRLNLRRKGLKTLPTEISHLSALTQLDLYDNELTTLPPEIGQLTTLTNLGLSNNQLTELPSEIGQLTCLTRLSLSNNQLVALPSQIGQLTNLTSLSLWGNELTSLPPEIGNLSNLKSLELGFALTGNQLEMLPPEIGQLSNLRELDLSNNQLIELPLEIGQLSNLIEMDISRNQLTMLPSEIGQLHSLTVLDLGNNQLIELPREVGQLSNLRKFDLGFNNLTELPTQIAHLTNLTELDLGKNRLVKLPGEIGQLTNLKEIDLSNNQLTGLPPEISQLSNLIEMKLNSNQLTMLPSEIGQLTKLTMLDLSNNRNLARLPPEIGQLTHLMKLNLIGPQLTELPTEIGQLSNLMTLALIGNKLTQLPLEIGQLTNLIKLDLHSNQLTTLPSEIGQLTNLTELNLSFNKLAELPSEIRQLTNLTIIDLQYNRLTELPVQINQLAKLTSLDLRDNLLSIPFEILERTDEPATILNYYFQNQIQQQHEPLNEAKVLLVGQGGVGKTSLMKRLIEDRFNPAENKTEGIAIHRCPITVNSQQIQLNVWDFGGQEIMHATHQFFLTKRSLYLLILDARLGEEENRLEYWLKIISSFGGESPIIVVGNKIDQQPLDLDKRGLMLKYPQIRAILETSCLDGRGLDELQAAIAREVSSLPHLNDQLLQSWFNVKTRLEGMDRDYLPYHEYLAMCQAESVDDDLSQRTLIGFLHDLGVVLNFQDDPRLEETNILNPEWVTSGVYKILNDPGLLTEHQGVLERTMLNRILELRRYPRDKHLFIVDMMRKFELCFDFEGFADRKFLIPDLLPKEEPDTGTWEGALAFQYHYYILPGSVISRFIVRMNYLIHEQTYWRSGVVLTHEGNTALVKADREDKKIFIWVAGPEAGRRRFLSIIRAQFDSIHQTIPGLEVQEKVPLPDYPEIVVDYQYLRDLEEMGEEYFVPPGLRQRVSVKKLLDGIEPEAFRRGGREAYHSGNIRQLLNVIFPGDELDTFCYDYFRSVHDQFGGQMNRQEKIQLLITYCEQHLQFEELLSHVQRINPRQYDRFM